MQVLTNRLIVLIIALIPVISIGLIDSSPAAAQSAGEYFRIDYSSANISQREVIENGLFYAATSGKLTCTKDLPMSVSEASITSRVIAKDMVKGTVVTLNPSYILVITPFPSKTGEVAELNQSVPLQFPDTAELGDYNVIAELIEARVKVAFIWAPVTEYLPQSQLLGSVKYISQRKNPIPEPSPAALPQPVLTLFPASQPEPVASPVIPRPGFVWWMWLVVAIALVTTVVNVTFILRHLATRRANNK